MKTYTKDELKGILKEHVKWLFGNGEQRADLRYADLRSAILSSAVLSYAVLSYAVLSKKYLQISCIGSRKGITTFCVEDDLIWCGC